MMMKLQDSLYRLLRWSEKYTKTDMVYLTKNGIWGGLSNLTGPLIVLLTTLAFSRLVTPDAYGQYKYVLATLNILGSFTLTGIGQALTRSVAKGADGSLIPSFRLNMKWSLPFTIGTFLFGLYYILRNNPAVGISLVIGSLLSPLLTSSNLFGSYLVAKKNFKHTYLYFELAGNGIPALALITTMLLSPTVINLIATYFVANLAVSLFFFYIVTRKYKADAKLDSEILPYSKHLSLINILSIISLNIDQVLLFHYLGASQLAIYNFAIAIPNQAKGPIKSLENLIFPKFAQGDPIEIKKGLGSKIIRLFLLMILLILIYILLAPTIYQLLFPQYIKSVLYSQIFVISILGYSFWPAITYLSAKKKVAEQYWVSLISSVSQIFLSIIGIITLGIWGAIVAKIISRITNGLIGYIFCIKS